MISNNLPFAINGICQYFNNKSRYIILLMILTVQLLWGIAAGATLRPLNLVRQQSYPLLYIVHTKGLMMTRNKTVKDMYKVFIVYDFGDCRNWWFNQRFSLTVMARAMKDKATTRTGFGRCKKLIIPRPQPEVKWLVFLCRFYLYFLTQ